MPSKTEIGNFELALQKYDPLWPPARRGVSPKSNVTEHIPTSRLVIFSRWAVGQEIVCDDLREKCKRARKLARPICMFDLCAGYLSFSQAKQILDSLRVKPSESTKKTRLARR